MGLLASAGETKQLRPEQNRKTGPSHGPVPRPLGGRTAREVYDDDRAPFLDRQAFARDVDMKEEELRRKANSRQDLEAARRRAVEQVLLRYRLMTIRGHV
jgi:hypothetical protein